MSTNFDTALREDAPTHRFPPDDIPDADRLFRDLLLSDVETILLVKSLDDDLFPRAFDTLPSDECPKLDLPVQDPTDAYDLVTLDELLDDLLDLDLLTECPNDSLALELADLPDLDLPDELPDKLPDNLLDDEDPNLESIS